MSISATGWRCGGFSTDEVIRVLMDISSDGDENDGGKKMLVEKGHAEVDPEDDNGTMVVLHGQPH